MVETRQMLINPVDVQLMKCNALSDVDESLQKPLNESVRLPEMRRLNITKQSIENESVVSSFVDNYKTSATNNRDRSCLSSALNCESRDNLSHLNDLPLPAFSSIDNWRCNKLLSVKQPGTEELPVTKDRQNNHFVADPSLQTLPGSNISYHNNALGNENCNLTVVNNWAKQNIRNNPTTHRHDNMRQVISQPCNYVNHEYVAYQTATLNAPMLSVSSSSLPHDNLYHLQNSDTVCLRNTNDLNQNANQLTVGNDVLQQWSYENSEQQM